MSHRAALSFTLEEGAFSVPLECVEAVVRAAWPVAVARAPFGCLGLLELRGELLPMVDTAALFALRRPLRPALDPEGLLGRQLLVVSLPSMRAALLVDQVLEVLGTGAELPTGQSGAENGAAGATPSEVDLEALLGGSRGRLLQRVAEAHLHPPPAVAGEAG